LDDRVITLRPIDPTAAKTRARAARPSPDRSEAADDGAAPGDSPGVRPNTTLVASQIAGRSIRVPMALSAAAAAALADVRRLSVATTGVSTTEALAGADAIAARAIEALRSVRLQARAALAQERRRVIASQEIAPRRRALRA
jgi:hypothetical protein